MISLLQHFVHKISDIWYNIRISNDEIMTSAMTKNRIQSDILEWHVSEEILAVLLKDRSTGRNRECGTDVLGEYGLMKCTMRSRIVMK